MCTLFLVFVLLFVLGFILLLVLRLAGLARSQSKADGDMAWVRREKAEYSYCGSSTTCGKLSCSVHAATSKSPRPGH